METTTSIENGSAEVRKPKKLSFWTKFFYGIGDLGNAIINSAIQFFLMKFYTDGALILPSLAGNALLIGKIWDAINDPLFGWIADRTNAKVGRRRVFMFFGAIPLGISIALLWFVPSGASRAATFTWIALTFMLFDTLWTMTNVPYYALTSELTDDYDERSALTTFRMVMAVPAYLVGVALTPMIVGFFAIERSGWGFIGILYGAICAVVLIVSALGIRERDKVQRAKAKTTIVDTIKATFTNKPFLQTLCGLPGHQYFLCPGQNAHGIFPGVPVGNGRRNLTGHGLNADLCDHLAALLEMGKLQDGQRPHLCDWNGYWRSGCWTNLLPPPSEEQPDLHYCRPGRDRFRLTVDLPLGDGG